MRDTSLAMVACVVIALGVSACGSLSTHDYESFTPPPAQVYPGGADCGRTEIGNAFAGPRRVGSGYWPGRGSIPDDFVPEKVVRCERGDDASGNSIVQAVTLVGDMRPVVEAFGRQSRRPRENVSVDCAFAATAPFALWFVAVDGSAIRPQWPTVVCGYQGEPLEPLNALREVGRTTVSSTGRVAALDRCGPSAHLSFRTTTESAADAQQVSDVKRLSFVLPTDDVDTLVICRYRISGESSTPTGRTVAPPADG